MSLKIEQKPLSSEQSSYNIPRSVEHRQLIARGTSQIRIIGEVAERLNALVLKTSKGE